MFDKLLLNPTALLAAADKAFVWQEHTREIITTALLSMVPTFEGRYAVTVALGMGMPPVFSYLLALICSSIPVPFILLLLRPVLDWFYTLPIRPVQSFAAWLERHAEKKRASMNEKNQKGIRGKESTPFLLARIKDLTGGDSLDSNIQLVYNNARLAAQIAKAYWEK